MGWIKSYLRIGVKRQIALFALLLSAYEVLQRENICPQDIFDGGALVRPLYIEEIEIYYRQYQSQLKKNCDTERVKTYADRLAIFFICSSCGLPFNDIVIGEGQVQTLYEARFNERSKFFLNLLSELLRVKGYSRT